MIITINDIIKQFEKIKAEHGNMFVRTQVQVGHLVDFDYKIIEFQAPNDDRTKLKVLVVEGYKKS